MNRNKKLGRALLCTSMASLLLSSNALAAYGIRFSSNVDVASEQVSYERERSEEEWARLRDNQIEWDEIQDLVHEYNPTVARNWVSFRESDGNGVYNIDYQEALDAIEESYDRNVETMGALYGEEVGNALAYLTYETSQARTTLDSSTQSTDRTATLLQLHQTEKTTVETLKKSIITIYTTEEQAKLAEKTAAYQNTLYEQSVRRKDVGSATEIDVMTALESKENADVSLVSANDNLEKLKQLLNVNLGWSYDATPDLCAVPMPTDEELDALDLEADTQTALQNNYSIRINERYLDISQTESQRSSLTVTIENQKQSLRSDMISRYQSVQQARASLEQAKLSEQNAQANYDKVSRSYSLGSASARDLESAQYQLDSATSARIIAEYTVAAEYYDYAAGVEGIATTS